MNFTSYTVEKSRDSFESAASRLKKVFPDAAGIIDAEYFDSERKRVVGISSLPLYAPICLSLFGKKEFLDFISSTDSDIHIVFGETVLVNSKEAPENISRLVKEEYKRAMAGVGALTENGEHVIDLKGGYVGTHYGINLLLGCRVGFENPMLTTPKSAVDPLGRGAFRAGADTQVLASRFVMNADEAGEPANRQFYLTEDNRQIFYSADVSSDGSNVKSAVCTHKPNNTVIEYETNCGLKIERTIFILPQYEGMPDAVEVQSVKITNLTERPRRIRIVMTGVLGIMDAASCNDIIYLNVIHQSSAVKDGDKTVAVSPDMHPSYAKCRRHFASLIANGETMDEYCVSYTDFVGGGTLERPERVARLTSHPQRRSAPFFAIAKTLDIGGGESSYVDEFVGYVYSADDSEEKLASDIKALREKFSSHSAVEKALSDVKDFYDAYSSYLTLKSGDRRLDSYINRNLPFQVLYQSFLSRSFAWTQKSFRQIGFREIQDMYPSLYYLNAMGNSSLAKDMICRWVENVYEYGYANHNFYWTGNGAGDCSDDQLWLIPAVCRYVSLTGDVAFLDEKYKVAGSDMTRSVFDTMTAAVDYSAKISVGKHSLPILDNADWNDCLKLDEDSISAPYKFELYKKQLKEKNQEWGVPFENNYCESVMNAFLLKIAEDDLASLAEISGRGDKAKELRRMSDELCRNIQTYAWKENFFARCLVNDPKKPYSYVGAKGDGLSSDKNIDGSYFLNSFSWSILSDCATESQIEAMTEPLCKYIKTEAGLMLSSPCDLGKVSSKTASDHYFEGDRENGAVFKHATMMATCAMFKAAKTVKSKSLAAKLSSLAFWMLDRVYPFKTMDNPYVLKGNPRFCTQYNNSETLENIGPMLSGTASWLALSVFEFLGISHDGNKITFSPVLPEDMTDVSFLVKCAKCSLDVKITKPKGFCRCGESTEYFLDGEKCDGTISLPSDKKRHSVYVKL